MPDSRRPTDAKGSAKFVVRSEKLIEDVAASASALTLQGPDISSSKKLFNNKSLEHWIAANPHWITANPQTVRHNTIDGTYPLIPDKPVAGAAESSSVLTLQEPDVSSMDKFLDSSLEESITASSERVLHNTIDGSSSTSSSSYEELVAGAVESVSAPILKGLDVSSLDVFLYSSSEESDSPRTVLHNIANASSSSTSSLGSDILVRYTPKCLQMFYISSDRRGYFWVYPYLCGPFKSIDDVNFSITLFDEVHRGDQFVTPNSGPDSSSSKNDNTTCHLIQALLDQYSDNHNLCGRRGYYHFNFTVKQKVDGKNQVFAEVSYEQGSKVLEVNCFSMTSTEDSGSHCYGCINNGNPDMKHPIVNMYSGGRLNVYLPFAPVLSSSDDEEEDAFFVQDEDGRTCIKYGNPAMSSSDEEEQEDIFYGS